MIKWITKPKTYAEIGYLTKLEPLVYKIFLAYMRERFPEEDQICITGYALEWAHRFKIGKEYDMSDLAGQEVLRNLAPGIYPRQ